VIVVGHAHFDGRRAFLNLPGIDLPYDDFAKLFDGVNCHQQVFFVTTPVSGFVTKPLSRPGRIVITATDNDPDVNETLSHTSLAQVLDTIEPSQTFDLNGDGAISLLELYVATTRDVAQRYFDDMLVITEHAQLDDNADGRGSELQIDYLPPEQGGRLTKAKPRSEWPEGRDGRLSVDTILRRQCQVHHSTSSACVSINLVFTITNEQTAADVPSRRYRAANTFIYECESVGRNSRSQVVSVLHSGLGRIRDRRQVVHE
jgi:hypothetical protein